MKTNYNKETEIRLGIAKSDRKVEAERKRRLLKKPFTIEENILRT